MCFDPWANSCKKNYPLVLLVGNEEAEFQSLKQSLAQENVRVALAHSVKEASEMIAHYHLRAVKVDGLLVDLRLPDGLAPRTILDFWRKYPSVPVAVMMSEDEAGFQLWTEVRGISLLPKSVTANALLACLIPAENRGEARLPLSAQHCV